MSLDGRFGDKAQRSQDPPIAKTVEAPKDRLLRAIDRLNGWRSRRRTERPTVAAPSLEGGKARFSDELVDADFAAGHGYKIKVLRSDPEVVVREGISLGEMTGEGKFEREDVLAIYEEGRALLAELREEYGIHIPTMDYLVREADKNGTEVAVVYALTQRIHGYEGESNLQELLKSGKVETSTGFVEKLESLYSNLLTYLKDKYASKADLVADLHNEQFTYGRRKDETEDSIYLVDLDPAFRTSYDNRGYFQLMGSLAGAIMETEECIKAKLPLTRAKFKECFSSFDPRHQGELRSYVEPLLS